MIVLDNICKAYEDKEVLVNTSFHIKKGEFIAMFGVSGCGKSTLLNILGMLEDKDAGQYQFMGRQAPDSHSKHAQRIRRHHIGYLFQNYALIDEETVEENLKYAQKYSKKSLKMKKAERERVLLDFGLEGLRETHIYKLSGGEQQRVAICRMLIQNNDVILCDEPTGSLDEANKTMVMDTLLALKHKGKTIIMVTHDRSLSRYFDRMVMLP